MTDIDEIMGFFATRGAIVIDMRTLEKISENPEEE